jgi:Secretion system C-terminal sorting domain
MMKKYFTLILISCTLTVHAQTINYKDDGGCYSINVQTMGNPSSSGSPARNTYTGTNGNGNYPIRVLWVPGSNRWEIQSFVGGTWLLDHFSTFTSAPNPPALSVGNWQNGPDCGSLTQFNGTGTQTFLPIELIAFDAQTTETGKTLLTWATASEKNNNGFEIEKSTDGVRFEKIGFVAGSGNSSREQRYSFEDAAPFTRAGQVVYYRLRQVDYDGQFEHSKAVSVRNSNTTTSIQIYPTTTTNTLTVTADGEPVDAVTVVNQVGQVVLTAQQVSSVDMSALPAGMYLVQVKAGLEQVTERVFKQ